MAGISVKFSALDNLSAQLNVMAAAGMEAERAMERFESSANNAMAAMADGAGQAAAALESAAGATDYWTEKIGNYDKDVMQAVWTTEELVESGYMTEDALTALAGAADEAAQSVEELGNESRDSSDDMEDFGKKSSEAVLSLDNILATAGIAAALKGIADSFMDCSDAAAEFETKVAMVSTVADTSVLSADELAEQISRTSTAMAQSVNGISEATYNAISAGIDTADAVDTVGQATELAVAGFTDMSSALAILTTATNAYQLSASEMENISDSLIMSQNLGVMTIDQLSSSMGKAISTASAYSIDLYNLESGYISLTKAGISVEESTTYLSSMFNELGKSGSEVANVLIEETGKSFGQLMNDGYTLADVLAIVYESADRDSEAFMNLWGSAEAGKAANAVINQGLEQFNINLEKLRNSAGTTQAAYETMTNTTEFANQRMTNSFANLQIAIGDDLNPVIGTLYNGIADVTDKVTEYIRNHPAFTAALTGGAVAVAAITVALGGYKVATVAAELATKAWTAVLGMNPVFRAVAAVAALTAGVVAFVSVLGDSEDEYRSWTESTRRQYDELQQLNREYEAAVEAHGEMSEEALRLKYQMDDLNESFEANKQTVEEFVAECDAMEEAHNNMQTAYEGNVSAIHTQEVETMALIQKLSDLASSTEHTTGTQQQMKAIINELNGSIDGLNLSYDDLIINQGNAVDFLIAMAEAQAQQELYNEQYGRYVQLLKEDAVLEKQIAETTDKKTAAQERYARAEKEYQAYAEERTKYDTSGLAGLGLHFSDQYKELKAAEKELNAVTTELEGMQGTLEQNERELDEINQSWNEIGTAAEDSAEHVITASEAVAAAVMSASDDINQLAQAYDAAYSAARESIEGQIGLFDTMKTESEQSVSDMQKAMESQIEYLNLYADNLQKAADYGLSGNMIAKLSDGSEESAGQLDAIIRKIEELGATEEGLTAEAGAFIGEFNSKFAQVERAKDIWAENVAQIETDFSDSLNEIQSDMENAIENMNMADEAAAAATATMDAYIAAIKSKTSEVDSAMAAVSMANSGTIGIAGYASGTRHAEQGLAIVGEEGPELVNFNGGEVVYTASETASMFSSAYAGDSPSGFYAAPDDAGMQDTASEDKTITLRIEGGGELQVRGGSGVSKEDVLEILMGNVKEALMGILSQEIMEEGELSYEF